ncbi:hypothetical protein BGZ94_000725 [Podila epigama]|nr:hypothetical protein BGZ94_000725 [Podila epigama]
MATMTQPTNQTHSTLKTKRSLRNLFVNPKEGEIPPTPKHAKTSSLDSSLSPTSAAAAGPPSYSVFLADLVSTFNALTAPNNCTVKTSFQGTEHEARVDFVEKKKVMRALQKANPAQVNKVISLLKAMPDPSTTPLSTATKTTTTKTQPTGPSTLTLGTASQPNSNYSHATLTKKTAARIQAKLRAENRDLGEDDLKEWNKIERKKPSERRSNDQSTGVLDEASAAAEASSIFSWWPSTDVLTLFTSSTTSSSSSPSTNNNTTTTSIKTTTPTFWSTLKGKPDQGSIASTGGTKKKNEDRTGGLSTGEQIAIAAAALMAAAAIARPKPTPKDKNAAKTKAASTAKANSVIATKTTKPPAATIATLKVNASVNASTNANDTTSSSSMSRLRSMVTKKSPLPPAAAEEPSFLVATINSLTRQFLALQNGPPPTHMISAYTFWWGYEIYIPHKCMANLDHGLNTSQIFLNLLSGAIVNIPGLSALVPIAKIISAWVGYQWGIIKTQDNGKGVVISATWVLPVALASRPWDHEGNEEDPSSSLPFIPVKNTLKSRLRLVKT